MRPVPLVVLAILASPLFAQAPLVEKIEVNVVNVDVTVTDHGRPVRGLTAGDFELFEDGVAQPISNFYAVETNAERSASDDRFRRKVLLLIDDSGISPYERNRALTRVEEFINDRFRGGEYDWSIASVNDGTLHMLLPPTSDKKQIHDALDTIRRRRKPQFEARPSIWTQIAIAQGNVDALIEATRAFGSATGKKIVLLLSAQLLPNDLITPDLQASREIALTRNDLIREANASNVNLYIVNPEGVAAGDSSMYWVARETGGRLLPGNRVEESLRQFDEGSSNYYSLGYRPKHGDDGVYHRIKLRLKKGDYALQYRDGYWSLPEGQQIERTLGSEFGTFMIHGSAIPVTLNFDQRREVEDGVVITMKTAVPAGSSFGPMDVFISLFDPTGRHVFSVRKTHDTKDALSDATEFFVRHGKPYRVVVAVRDEVSETVGVTQQVVQF